MSAWLPGTGGLCGSCTVRCPHSWLSIQRKFCGGLQGTGVSGTAPWGWEGQQTHCKQESCFPLMDTCGSAWGQCDLPLVGLHLPTLNSRSDMGVGWERSMWSPYVNEESLVHGDDAFLQKGWSLITEIQIPSLKNPMAYLASNRDPKLKEKPFSSRYLLWALGYPLKWGRGQTFSVNSPEGKCLRLETTLCLSQWSVCYGRGQQPWTVAKQKGRLCSDAALLPTQKFKFHIILICHEILFSFWFYEIILEITLSERL